MSIILFVILRKITAVISLFCTNIMQLVFCAILPMASQDTILASDYPIYAPKQAKNGLKSLIGLRILRILPYEIRISPLKKLQKWRMCELCSQNHTVIVLYYDTLDFRQIWCNSTVTSKLCLIVLQLVKLSMIYKQLITYNILYLLSLIYTIYCIYSL